MSYAPVADQTKRVNHLVGELDKLKEYYEFGESLYPYTGVTGKATKDPHVQRRSLTQYSNRMNNSSYAFSGAIWTGALSTFVVTKLITRGAVWDLSCMFKSPARSLAIFFYTVGIMGMINTSAIVQSTPAFGNH